MMVDPSEILKTSCPSHWMLSGISYSSLDVRNLAGVEGNALPANPLSTSSNYGARGNLRCSTPVPGRALIHRVGWCSRGR